MTSTEKVSVSLDIGSLVLARRAAALDGVSLSAWLSRLVRAHAWDSERPLLAPADQARQDEHLVALDEDEAATWQDTREHRAAG